MPFSYSAIRKFASLIIATLVAAILGTAAPVHTGATVGAKFGDGTLTPAPGSPYNSPNSTGPQNTGIVSGDFNGDGLPDLAVASYAQNSTVTILLATRTGTFVSAPGSPIPAAPYHDSLAAADFNSDGNLDLASLGPQDVEILQGDGHGGFGLLNRIQASSIGVTGMSGVEIGDFNRDGKTDLVVVGYIAEGQTSVGSIAVLLGDGRGNFALATGSPLQVPQSLTHATVADFNRDGSLDLAVTSARTNEVVILLNNGSGGFSPGPQGPLTTGQLPMAIGHGDFNGDGIVDLAVANEFDSTVTILVGDGTGGFVQQPVVSLPYGCDPQGLAVGDLDGDGKLDLALAVANGPDTSLVAVLLGDGNGSFQIPGPGFIQFRGEPVGITLDDFNADGRLDVATANFEGTAAVLLGTPVPSSTQLSIFPPTVPTVGVPISFAANTSSNGFDLPTGAVTLQDGSAALATGILEDDQAILPTTFTTAGTHSLVGVYGGDLRTNGSTTQPFVINVAKGKQTITFPTLPNHSYGDPPFAVTATSSSGLPVTVSLVSGPATIANNVLTLTGSGVVVLQASQPGDANYLPAPNVEQQLEVGAPSLRIDAVLNAASYQAGALAPGSFAVMFGAGLASVASSSGNLPSALGGTSIQIADASGKTSNAQLYFASPTQIDFLLPADLSPGTGQLTLQTQSGPSAMAQILIAAVDPGLFSADATGTGVAAGAALRVSADGTQTQLPINNCRGAPLVCTAIPIDLGSDTDTVYLVLYGTGIRGRSALSSITVTIGGVAANVLYAGAQPEYAGLDQLNLQVNPALRGRGKVEIALSVNGIFANVVNVVIQ